MAIEVKKQALCLCVFVYVCDSDKILSVLNSILLVCHGSTEDILKCVVRFIQTSACARNSFAFLFLWRM